MTQLKAEDPRSSSDSSVDTMEWEKGIGADIRRAKAACSTHGPSQTPTLDRDLQSPRAREYILGLAAALTNLANEDCCTQCTVERVSRLLTAQARDIKAANQQKGWTREEKKIRKAEFKMLCQGAKKDLKALWKGKR